MVVHLKSLVLLVPIFWQLRWKIPSERCGPHTHRPQSPQISLWAADLRPAAETGGAHNSPVQAAACLGSKALQTPELKAPTITVITIIMQKRIRSNSHFLG